MREHKIGTLRLRSIRPKNGGAEIRVLHGQSREDSIRFAEKRVGRALNAFPDRLVGFALVAWGADNGSVALITVNEGS